MPSAIRAVPIAISAPAMLRDRIASMAATEGRRVSTVGERLLRRGLAVEAGERVSLADIVAMAIDRAGGVARFTETLCLGADLDEAGVAALADGTAAPAEGRVSATLVLAIPGLLPEISADQVRVACAVARLRTAPAA